MHIDHLKQLNLDFAKVYYHQKELVMRLHNLMAKTLKNFKLKKIDF
jgi:hypothetical protein